MEKHECNQYEPMPQGWDEALRSLNLAKAQIEDAIERCEARDLKCFGLSARVAAFNILCALSEPIGEYLKPK